MKRRMIALGVMASLALSTTSHSRVEAPQPSPRGGSAVAIYGELNNEFVAFIDGNEFDIGPLAGTFPSGGFVGNDFTREYVIGYPLADLYAVDTADAATTLIGNTSLSGGLISGPRWDPATDQVFIAQCGDGFTTLYAIDTSSGAVQNIGISSGTCIVAMAFDPNGNFYGLDTLEGALVSIDPANGGVQKVGPVSESFVDVAGMEFDPSTGILYFIAKDANSGVTGLYTFDVNTGGATLIGPYPDGFSAFDLGEFANDTIFASGFDSG